MTPLHAILQHLLELGYTHAGPTCYPPDHITKVHYINIHETYLWLHPCTETIEPIRIEYWDHKLFDILDQYNQ